MSALEQDSSKRPSWHSERQQAFDPRAREALQIDRFMDAQNSVFPECGLDQGSGVKRRVFQRFQNTGIGRLASRCPRDPPQDAGQRPFRGCRNRRAAAFCREPMGDVQVSSIVLEQVVIGDCIARR